MRVARLYRSTHGRSAAVVPLNLRPQWTIRARAYFTDLKPSMGFMSISGEDDFFQSDRASAQRHNVPSVAMVFGDCLRQWSLDVDLPVVVQPSTCPQFRWPYRASLSARLMFGKTPAERGIAWYDFMYVQAGRRDASLLIGWSEVATHNRFVLDHGGKVFNQTAPVIKLASDASEDSYLELLGLLNSSSACFWMKQICFPKGGDTVGKEGARIRKLLWDVYYAFDGTKLKQFPMPEERPLAITKLIQTEADARSAILPDRLCFGKVPNRPQLGAARDQSSASLARMIAFQEELDWQCYRLYGASMKT